MYLWPTCIYVFLHQHRLLELSTAIFPLSAPWCTVRVQRVLVFPQEDETWRIITVSSCNISPALHVLFCVQPPRPRTQMHRGGLDAALQRGSEGYLSSHWAYSSLCIPGSGFQASNASVIPRMITAARQTLLYIHSKR